MNFRASFGHDLSSTLESGSHEMPIDRIAAFSRASRLGTLLWRLKYGFDASVYQRTADLLASESHTTTQLAEMLIREWLNPNCEQCGGNCEYLISDKRIVCPKCNGLGLKRYSDHARARFMDMTVEDWRKVSNQVKRVMDTLTRAERLVSATMHAELER